MLEERWRRKLSTVTIALSFSPDFLYIVEPSTVLMNEM